MASPGASIDAMIAFLQARAPSVPASAHAFTFDDFRGFAPSAFENALYAALRNQDRAAPIGISAAAMASAPNERALAMFVNAVRHLQTSSDAADPRSLLARISTTVSFASSPVLRLGQTPIDLAGTAHAPLADLAIAYALRFARIDASFAAAAGDGGEETTRLRLLLSFLFKKADFAVAKANLIAGISDGTPPSTTEVALPREGALSRGAVLAEKRSLVSAETRFRDLETAGVGIVAAAALVYFCLAGPRAASIGPPAVAASALALALCLVRAGSVSGKAAGLL
jgi:hypothetical protein